MKKTVLITSITLIVCSALYSANVFKKTAQAYLFSYPLVLMDATRINMEQRTPNNSASNLLTHMRGLPTHEFRAVVRPNNDTLYSIAWFDLSDEPQIISTPEMNDTYFVLPFMDAWTNVFSTVGTRTTGNQATQFALVGPDWKGTLPAQLHRIDAPTNMVWMIGRTEVKDLKNPQSVFDLQDQFRLAGLADWQLGRWKENIQETSVSINVDTQLSPPDEIASLDAEQFFDRFSALLMNQHATIDDQPAIDNLADLGIVAGEAFAPNMLDEWLMNKAMNVARQKLLDAATQREPNEDNWFVIRDGIGRYGQDYATRAFVALYGLGALPPEEASYPNTSHDSSHQTLDGQHRYRIHWDREQLPPVNAFWSLTIYDKAGYMIENPINRYRMGSNNDLSWNADGSLELQLQSSAPDTTSANWLPVPKGEFNIVLRMYWPQQEFLDNNWQLPTIERLP